MFIQISTTNKCQLECKWCVNEKLPYEHMSYDNFVYIVDGYVDTFETIHLVDMTPIVGELSQNPNWLEMLEYLYEKDEVLKFDFVTNFLDYDKQTLRKLFKFRDKMEMVISVYGHDKESFSGNTGIDKWFGFVESLTNLQEVMSENGYECFPITFYMRDIPYDDIPKQNFTHIFIKALKFISKNHVNIDSTMAGINHNWAGQKNVPNGLESVEIDDEICLHSILQNCVLPNGDITLCGMNDFNNKLIIGNVFEKTLSQIYGEGSLYEHYMKNIPEMCMECSEYEPKSNELQDVISHENKLNNGIKVST